MKAHIGKCNQDSTQDIEIVVEKHDLFSLDISSTK